MLWKLLLPLLVLAVTGQAQTLYDPQQVYDDGGGLYDPDSLRSIYVDFHDPAYHTMLVDSFWTNPSFRLLADVSLNGDTLHDVGVRYKGNSTYCGPWFWGKPKFPYNMDMNYLVSGQKLLGYKKIKLSNAWSDGTFAREFAGSQLYRRYVPTYEVNLVKLYAQGAYLGLYANTESVNKQFLEKHFGEKDGVLVKCDADMEFCISYLGIPSLSYLSADTTDYFVHYEMKSDHGWAELLALIETLNNDPTELDTILNIDRVLWNFALNTCLSNLDSYNGLFIHNYYLYQTEDGLFQMIPWDISEVLGGNAVGSAGGDSAVYNRDPYQSGPLRPLLDTLMADPLHRMQYNAHIRTIMEESMDTTALRAIIGPLQVISELPAYLDTNKIHSNQAFYATVDSTYGGNGGFMSMMTGRKEFLSNHPEVSLIPPDILSVSVVATHVEATVMNTSSVELMTTFNEQGSKFNATQMYDDGLNGDQIAGDGVFTAMLPPGPAGSEVKFYVRAMNSDAMRLSPERAEYEFYETELTVNIEEPVVPLKPGNLVRITDILGRDIISRQTGVQLWIYDNGVVQRRVRLIGPRP
jgi:spore coat protein CotH